MPLEKDSFQVKRSRISGNGLFANRAFKKGETLFLSYKKNEFVKSNIWQSQFEQQILNSYANHSENCNSENVFNHNDNCVYFVAIKEIAIGQEITTNYKSTIELVRRLGYEYEDSNSVLWFE